MYFIYRIDSLRFFTVAKTERGAKNITTKVNKEVAYHRSRDPNYNEFVAYATEEEYKEMVKSAKSLIHKEI